MEVVSLNNEKKSQTKSVPVHKEFWANISFHNSILKRRECHDDCIFYMYILLLYLCTDFDDSFLSAGTFSVMLAFKFEKNCCISKESEKLCDSEKLLN